jgi:hypothetical protein
MRKKEQKGEKQQVVEAAMEGTLYKHARGMLRSKMTLILKRHTKPHCVTSRHPTLENNTEYKTGFNLKLVPGLRT